MAGSPSTLAQFFAQHKKLHYKKGEVILRAGDYPRGVCYLDTGFVRQYSISPNGDELTLIIFKPGDFFPIIWAFHNTRYSYYLETATPVELYSAPREDFLEFVRENNIEFLKMTQNILVRMGAIMTRMEHLVFGNAYDKVASILLLCADRFGVETKEGIELPDFLTHKQIADLIGLSRETASVEIKNLERDGLISQKKAIIITDLEKLKKESLLHETF